MLKNLLKATKAAKESFKNALNDELVVEAVANNEESIIKEEITMDKEIEREMDVKMEEVASLLVAAATDEQSKRIMEASEEEIEDVVSSTLGSLGGHFTRAGNRVKGGLGDLKEKLGFTKETTFRRILMVAIAKAFLVIKRFVKFAAKVAVATVGSLIDLIKDTGLVLQCSLSALCTKVQVAWENK